MAKIIMENQTVTLMYLEKVFSDRTMWVAIVGFLGVVTGATIPAATTFVVEWWKHKPQRELDNKRKILLLQMLRDEQYSLKWRYLSTLSSVIGTSEEEAKRLLIEIGARGHEKNDGRWGLISEHPLEKTQE